MADRQDVIVIGAGAAGLAAAAGLGRSGHTVLLLDARDRIGGRIWTRLEPGLTAPMELGAEFIHGDSPETPEMLAQVGAAAVDASGAHWSLIHGRLQRRADSLLGQVRAAFESADVLSKPDASLESFLTGGAARGLSEEAKALARSFASGFDAADPRLVSLHSIAEEWRSGGMLDSSQSRPSRGYHTALQALSAALDRTRVHVRLGTLVTALHWSRGSVEAEARWLGRPCRMRARSAIVTVPVGVLQAPADAPGAIRFMPALDSKQPALERLICGSVLKVMLRFRRPFWEERDGGRYADAAFFHASGSLFPTLWTALPVRAPLLTAWVGGPAAARLCESSEEKIVREAMDCIGTVFPGADVHAEMQSAHLHNWSRDPLACGAYSYVAVGGGHARETLAAPLDGTLFFAGEATDTTGEAATVTGALRSGARAAMEASRHLARGP